MPNSDANSDDVQLEEERFSMFPTQKLFRPLGWWVAGDITTVSVGLSRPPSPTLGPPWDRIIIQTPTGCVTTEETKPRKSFTFRPQIQPQFIIVAIFLYFNRRGWILPDQNTSQSLNE